MSARRRFGLVKAVADLLPWPPDRPEGPRLPDPLRPERTPRMGPFPLFGRDVTFRDLGRTAVAFADQPPPPAPAPREPVFAARFAGAAPVLVATDAAPVALISRVTKGRPDVRDRPLCRGAD